jgi:hypothetical protein
MFTCLLPTTSKPWIPIRILASLTEEEKKCAAEHMVIDVWDVAGQTNHIIVIKVCKEVLDLLFATWLECGVPDNNKYTVGAVILACSQQK